MNKFPHPFYIKDAIPEGVAEVYDFLRPFYDRYPTGNEIGEALHQIRREFNLIEEVKEKKTRVKKLIEELGSDLD